MPFIFVETAEDTVETKGVILTLKNIVQYRTDGNIPKDFKADYNSLLDSVETMFQKTNDIEDISEAKAIEAREKIAASKTKKG